MKTIKQDVIENLERIPAFRERKNKNKYIALILEAKYATRFGASMNTLEALICDAASYDRAWRQALEQRPDLRGSDYEKKDDLENKKLEELGYNVRKFKV